MMTLVFPTVVFHMTSAAQSNHLMVPLNITPLFPLKSFLYFIVCRLLHRSLSLSLIPEAELHLEVTNLHVVVPGREML